MNINVSVKPSMIFIFSSSVVRSSFRITSSVETKGTIQMRRMRQSNFWNSLCKQKPKIMTRISSCSALSFKKRKNKLYTCLLCRSIPGIHPTPSQPAAVDGVSERHFDFPPVLFLLQIHYEQIMLSYYLSQPRSMRRTENCSHKKFFLSKFSVQ